MTVDVGRLDRTQVRPFEVGVDGPYDPPTARVIGPELRGWGYRWIRLRRSSAA